MGQAKRRREALRQTWLAKSSEWDFPASEWETVLYAELESQPVLIVRRAPADQLKLARMETNECHANVRWYVDNDPSKESRAVTGWWVQEMCYVHHSVVEQDGELFCITPSSSGEKQIPFIPDPKISWRREGETYRAVRNGSDIGPGIRKSPGFVMAVNAIIRDRLLAGMDPFEANEFSDKEVEELRRKHFV